MIGTVYRRGTGFENRPYRTLNKPSLNRCEYCVIMKPTILIRRDPRQRVRLKCETNTQTLSPTPFSAEGRTFAFSYTIERLAGLKSLPSL